MSIQLQTITQTQLISREPAHHITTAEITSAEIVGNRRQRLRLGLRTDTLPEAYAFIRSQAAQQLFNKYDAGPTRLVGKRIPVVEYVTGAAVYIPE
jgi:hypothetical protein